MTGVEGNSITPGQAPSTETFSFKAPLLPASASKQRRVSLALASSPRVVPTSAWSFRDDTGLGTSNNVQSTTKTKSKIRKLDKDYAAIELVLGEEPESKKLRKKWTQEETQMLVEGCNKHGVGNWKTILNDPELKFDNRSPVDLKDR